MPQNPITGAHLTPSECLQRKTWADLGEMEGKFQEKALVLSKVGLNWANTRL